MEEQQVTRNLLTFLLCLLTLTSTAAEPVKVTVSGCCRNAKDGDALCFATVRVKELNLSMLTDINGCFKFPAVKGKNYTVSVSYINCVEREVQVKAGVQGSVDIDLEQQSYALEEVEVMAEYDPHKGSAAVINQQALEHIQPTSVADVMTLMPGGLYQQNNATGFNRISLRQSGSDDNTSLGMAVVMDGISMDNDGYRSQIAGMQSSDEYASRLGWNRGIDLKSLSTDHVQRIEIVKGISSAKWGNLSSGVMSLNSKVGQTPLQVRLKADPLTKLVYVGKGMKLSSNAGFLHVGMDYTSVYDDRRDPLNKYSRLTGQLTWNNSFDVWSKPLFLFFRSSETYTLNQAKEDELTEEFNEMFKNKYSRTALAFKARLTELGKWLDNVEYISSLDYTYDRIDRNRYVQLDIPLPSPVNSETGEHEGIFLPSAYYSGFHIDNQPLTWLNQLNAESIFETAWLKNKLVYGAEWKYTKNVGEGVVVDMNRPPYPDNSEYVRPTPNSQIPALSVGAAYVEEQVTHSNRYFDLALNAGVRLTKMFGLNRTYTELGKMVAEPRINGAVSFNIPMGGGKPLKAMLRMGYGQENKLPTLDYIYPDPEYKDLIMLSAYVKQNDANNYLLTDTRKYDVTNYQLRPNRNNKWEGGVDLSYEGFLLSLTVFSEKSSNGFGSLTTYHPVSYLRYMEPKDGQGIIGRRPTKEDYVEEKYETFVDIPVVRNCVKTEKRGLEYRLAFPKILPLATTIEINGAYYETEYGQTAPVEYHPSFKDNNKPLPYVGVYGKDDVTRRRIFNTNVWFNTNIPRYKMVFTTFFQMIWLNDVKRINGDEYPTYYYGSDGKWQVVDESIIGKINGGDLTWRHYHIYKEDYYEKEPVSLTVNFKLTKELSRMVKGAFFVNNILDINPTYKNRYQQNTRTWKKAFFGAELTFCI